MMMMPTANSFELGERMSSAFSASSISLASSGPDEDDDEDDDDFEDSRTSFASAVAVPTGDGHLSSGIVGDVLVDPLEISEYNVWMVDPGPVEERRMRLLQVMGLSANKEFLRVTTSKNHGEPAASDFPEGTVPPPPLSASSAHDGTSPAVEKMLSGSPSPSPAYCPTVIVRSRSYSGIEDRFQELAVTSPHLQRATSAPSLLFSCRGEPGALISDVSSARFSNDALRGMQLLPAASSSDPFFCKIKNLDTGKEFIVNEDGTWNCLGDIDTGRHLTLEEFERRIGYSPIVKELMRRENVKFSTDYSTPENLHLPLPPKRLKASAVKKRGGWLKNIKGVANSVTGMMAEREYASSFTEGVNVNSKWVKVRQHGKSRKELTGLYMCQEIQAHQGSIWTIKFSLDSRYLASAGADRVIHVWQASERESLLSGTEETYFCSSRSLGSSALNRPPLGESCLSKRRNKVSSSLRKNPIPDYVVVPDTVISLSDKPVCSFQGHLDDILDLSWSTSQLLLSSSMDKTVRLWDLESRACLKLFAHNDYVTSIQFNPIDDRYFISGSLDAKVRIWSIPERQVVDWTDLHEMVTAACYTPDGQGALVGSHKGMCRFYDTSEDKLHQRDQHDIKSKRKKSHAKKITGIQFAPGSSSEVLVTSADSQIRIFDGSDLIGKYRGFRNRSSQIAASFTADRSYVVSASEDSHVFVWKCDELQCLGGFASGGDSANSVGGDSGGRKSRVSITTRSYEYFESRDVSVAIPWPGPKPELTPMSGLSKRSQSSFPKKSSSNQIYNQEEELLVRQSHSDTVFAAWGLAIVTAGLGGEIRIYQNFGLPVQFQNPFLRL